MHFDQNCTIHLKGNVSKCMISRSATSMWDKSIEVLVLKKWINRREIFASKWKERNETSSRSEMIEADFLFEVNRPKVKIIEEYASKWNDRKDFCIEVKVSNMILSRSAWIEGDFVSRICYCSIHGQTRDFLHHMKWVYQTPLFQIIYQEYSISRS